MDDRIRSALTTDRVIDITTTGRTSGLPRRIETWFHLVGDTVYLTGTPGRRDWYANLVANPEFVFHLKESIAADLPARATPVTGASARRDVLSDVTTRVGQSERLEQWIAGSPLVKVRFLDSDGGGEP